MKRIAQEIVMEFGEAELLCTKCMSELTMIALDRKESKWAKKPDFKSEYTSFTSNAGTQQPPATSTGDKQSG